MFITKLEKRGIETSIRLLESIVEKLNTEVIYLNAKIKVLDEEVRGKKRTMSPEGRAKMSQMMKDRHAKMKLEKSK